MENELGEAAAILRAGPFEVAAADWRKTADWSCAERDKGYSASSRRRLPRAGSREFPWPTGSRAGKYGLLVHDVGVGDAKISWRETADKLKARNGSWRAGAGGAAVEGKIAMVCAVTPGRAGQAERWESRWGLASCRIWAARRGGRPRHGPRRGCPACGCSPRRHPANAGTDKSCGLSSNREKAFSTKMTGHGSRTSTFFSPSSAAGRGAGG